jgi:hypothetical protein
MGVGNGRGVAEIAGSGVSGTDVDFGTTLVIVASDGFGFPGCVAVEELLVHEVTTKTRRSKTLILGNINLLI